MVKQISSDKEMSPILLLSSLGELGGGVRNGFFSSLGLEAAEELRQGSMGVAQVSGGYPPYPPSGLLRSPAPFLLEGSLHSG